MPKVVSHPERREQLADAVLRVAARHGVGSVTTRAVAEESGWSTGVLNYYFSSRHDLLLAGLHRAAEIQGQHYEAIRADPGLDARARLVELTASVLPLDERRLAMTRVFLFFYAEGLSQEPAREAIAGYLARWRAVVTQSLAAAVDEGALPRELDIEDAALRLTATTDGLAVQAVLDPRVMAAIGVGGAVPEIVRGALPFIYIK